MSDETYFDNKINQFKQMSKKPLVTRVNIEVLIEAIDMDIRPFTNIRYESPKAILLYLAKDFHYPIVESDDRKTQSQIVLYALHRLMEIHYPWSYKKGYSDTELFNEKDKITINEYYDRINPDLILEIGYRKTLGDTGKYLKGSWCMLDSETFLNGAIRHLLKHDKGVTNDEEGGTHLSSAAWGMTCLYWTMSKSDKEIADAKKSFNDSKPHILPSDLEKFCAGGPKITTNNIKDATNIMKVGNSNPVRIKSPQYFAEKPAINVNDKILSNNKDIAE